MTTFSNRWTWLVIARATAGILLCTDVCAAQDSEQSVSVRTDLADVFPLKASSRWVYDYTQRVWTTAYGSGTIQWETGTVTFTVEGMSEEGSRTKWTILEEDNLHYADTSRSISTPSYYYQAHDSTIVRNITFSLFEEFGPTPARFIGCLRLLVRGDQTQCCCIATARQVTLFFGCGRGAETEAGQPFMIRWSLLGIEAW